MSMGLATRFGGRLSNHDRLNGCSGAGRLGLGRFVDTIGVCFSDADVRWQESVGQWGVETERDSVVGVVVVVVVGAK